MVEDQATLGTFTAAEGESSDGGGTTDGQRPAESASTDDRDGGADADGDLVCPWCLADADRFVEAGPTGLGCGRCSATLPVDADWFRAREVVARRPMYETED